MEITVAEATNQICQNLPGLAHEHAEYAARILVALVNDDPSAAEDKFFQIVEGVLRAGEEWAIQVAMASVRKVG
jgi:hypothetical protein